jgi:hypothetical protein
MLHKHHRGGYHKVEVDLAEDRPLHANNFRWLKFVSCAPNERALQASASRQWNEGAN